MAASRRSIAAPARAFRGASPGPRAVVPSRGVRRVLALPVCCALLAGCGGGERQDAAERSGAYEVDVVASEFPGDQSISQPAAMRIAVRNVGDRTIPNVAVSLAGLSTRNPAPDLADPEEAVWVIQDQPREGETALDFTWALGRLAPGRTREFTWELNPAIPGTHTVKWTVAAGLHGKAIARTADGKRPAGAFTVRVSDRPAQATVDPQTGEVVTAK